MYCGFGLRKEVYTRKPKKAFEKVRNAYKEEALNRTSNHANEDPVELTKRIRKKLARDRDKEWTSKVITLCVTLSFGFICFLVIKFLFIAHQEKQSHETKPAYFKSVIYHGTPAIKVDYFKGGPKASESQLRDGMLHQNSESYYETGEQFRSALYFYDTLVREVYFYRNGDTIKNFPPVPESMLRHIIIPISSEHKRLEFDFYDGKIVGGTYVEN